MQEPNVTDWIVAVSTVISAVAIPLLLLFLTNRFSKINSTQEKLYALQEKLQDHRIEVYNKILEPYIIITIPKELYRKQTKQDRDRDDIVGEIIQSLDYKKAEFKLFFMGSDEVVFAYKELQTYYFSGTSNPQKMITLLTNLIVKIRKSVGNEDTKVISHDAISWFVKDPDKVTLSP